jgi:tRNA A37 N6-isopentenylltransferase MiaA
VRRLREEWPLPWSKTAMTAIGYVEMMGYLGLHTIFQDVLAQCPCKNILPSGLGYDDIRPSIDTGMLNASIECVITRTRQYAKRQTAWFQHQIHPVWIETSMDEPPEQLADRVAATWQQLGPMPFTI